MTPYLKATTNQAKRLSIPGTQIKMEGEKCNKSVGWPGNLEPDYKGDYIYYIPMKTSIWMFIALVHIIIKHLFVY